MTSQFHYGDKVEVVRGFYKGKVGYISHKTFFGNYRVNLAEYYNKRILCSPDEIHLVAPKIPISKEEYNDDELAYTTKTEKDLILEVPTSVSPSTAQKILKLIEQDAKPSKKKRGKK